MNFRLAAGTLGFIVALGAASHEAQAADIARPVVVPPINPFEGFYIGGHFGYGWADRSGCFEIFDFRDDHEWEGCDDDEEDDLDFDYDQDGGLLGAQVGINHAFGAWGGHNWIIGAEVSADLSGMTGTLDLFDDEEFDIGGVGDWDWLGFGMIKLGLTWSNWMVYADVGYALGGFNYSDATGCSFSSNHQGWAAGLGLAWATSPTNNWFIDWKHAEFEDKDARCNSFAFVPVRVNTDPDVDVLRIGFNHHFRP
jgi:opacity protein-like surface antigen